MIKAGILKRFKGFKEYLDSPEAIAPQYNMLRPLLAFIDLIVIPTDDNVLVDIGSENTQKLFQVLSWRYTHTTTAWEETRWGFNGVMERFDLAIINDNNIDASLPSSFSEKMSSTVNRKVVYDGDGNLQKC